MELKCDEPPDVTNANRTGVDQTGNSVDSEVEYQCEGNRLFSDLTKRKTIRCLLGGTWSTLSHPQCNGRLIAFIFVMMPHTIILILNV